MYTVSDIVWRKYMSTSAFVSQVNCQIHLDYFLCFLTAVNEWHSLIEYGRCKILFCLNSPIQLGNSFYFSLCFSLVIYACLFHHVDAMQILDFCDWTWVQLWIHFHHMTSSHFVNILCFDEQLSLLWFTQCLLLMKSWIWRQG